MVILKSGNREINLNKKGLTLNLEDQKQLLNGNFILDLNLPDNENNKNKKTYYVGVLFELFTTNYSPQFSKKEICFFMGNYPLFINNRQIENILFDYKKLKKENDVLVRIK